ncbi:MAG: membrane protein insertion efficiency factor YidD [Candidatus Binatia bacterium]
MAKEQGKIYSSSLSHVRIQSSLGAQLLKGVIRTYRSVLSPVLGPTCRFYPSCSAYALAAIEKYGAIRGVGLAIRRLAKCHPWHPGGIDPLP